MPAGVDGEVDGEGERIGEAVFHGQDGADGAEGGGGVVETEEVADEEEPFKAGAVSAEDGFDAVVFHLIGFPEQCAGDAVGGFLAQG